MCGTLFYCVFYCVITLVQVHAGLDVTAQALPAQADADGDAAAALREAPRGAGHAHTRHCEWVVIQVVVISAVALRCLDYEKHPRGAAYAHTPSL
jgi:hypothetical protein